MKKIAILFIIFILFFTSIIPIQGQARPQIVFKNERLIDFIIKQKFRLFNIDLPNTFTFNPEDIVLKDDAFHGGDPLNFAEWWYFDAIFDNNYSAQISIYIFGILNQKFIVTGITLYRNGISVFSNEKYYIFNDLTISTQMPYIEIDGKQFMKGYIDIISGNWTYDITIDVNDANIDLQFIGKSRGWKGDLSIGGWAVILPKAEVKGKISLYGNEFDVKGVGYHDHNWGMNLFHLLNFGWYWGRIHSDNYTIVWFVISKTRFDGENLCVISKDNGDYINIDPKDIYFNSKDYSLDFIWLVPNSFILKVNNRDVYLSILMNAKSIDSDYKIPGHYWRYHLNCLGNIIIDNELKEISGTHISEFMRLR